MKQNLNIKYILKAVMYFCLIFTVIILVVSSMGFKRDGPTVEEVKYIKDVKASVDGGPWEEITLPHTFKNLKARTPVSVKAMIKPNIDDGVYIKTVYSPAKIYFDDKFVFQFGKKENYPDYMLDPATEIHIVETYGSGQEIELRMDFLSPRSRNSLIVHPPMMGTSKELIMERSRMLGIPLVFSIFQIVGGISLIIISAFVFFIDKKGILFCWLGLFSLSTGMWAFGENNFSSVIFRGSTFLYLTSFIGFFTFIIPLLRFQISIVAFKNPKPLVFMKMFFTISSAAALVLQLLGIVSCSKSMYFFHIFLPCALFAMSALTVREYIKYKNVNALRFIAPICILALTAILELLNYQLPVTYVFSSIFQIGILVFLLIMGITAGLYIKDSIDLRNKNKELTFENGLMEIQIKEQENRNVLLLEKENTLRQERHDLKHHITAIREMVNEDNKPLLDYLDYLMEQIPSARKTFCENTAANAILAHYDSICKEKGIELNLNLALPQGNENLKDAILCSILGNLLENATEACMRIEDGQKFIKMNSSVHYDILTITMDNSCDGKIKIENGRFFSSKRDGFGIGTASIKNLAKKAGGDAQFKCENNIFYSSVYVRL